MLLQSDLRSRWKRCLEISNTSSLQRLRRSSMATSRVHVRPRADADVAYSQIRRATALESTWPPRAGSRRCRARATIGRNCWRPLFAGAGVERADRHDTAAILPRREPRTSKPAITPPPPTHTEQRATLPSGAQHHRRRRFWQPRQLLLSETTVGMTTTRAIRCCSTRRFRHNSTRALGGCGADRAYVRQVVRAPRPLGRRRSGASPKRREYAARVPPSNIMCHIASDQAFALVISGRAAEAVRLTGEILPLADRAGLHAGRAHLLMVHGVAKSSLGDPGGVHDLNTAARSSSDIPITAPLTCTETSQTRCADSGTCTALMQPTRPPLSGAAGWRTPAASSGSPSSRPVRPTTLLTGTLPTSCSDRCSVQTTTSPSARSRPSAAVSAFPRSNPRGDCRRCFARGVRGCRLQ